MSAPPSNMAQGEAVADEEEDEFRATAVRSLGIFL